MTRSQEIILDTTLILAGMGLSVLFISIDGNGQNPIPVAGEISIAAAIIGVISFILARLIQSRLFASIATIIIIELLLILLSFWAVASSSSANEILYLLPVVTAIFTLPVVTLASVGFVRLASYFYRGRAKSV